MDINSVIASNLTLWMNENAALDTVQKVEKKSGVGFGTVRRAKNGEGNITAKNMELIAKAFGRHPAELMVGRADTQTAKNLENYAGKDSVTRLSLSEPITKSVVLEYRNPLIDELVTVCKGIDDNGLREAIGYLKRLSDERRPHKANTAK